MFILQTLDRRGYQKKNGFELVGRLKENAWKNGEYVDELIYEKFL